MTASMRFLRTVHNRGSLTLPSDIRNVLEIQEGDVVEFEVLRIVRRKNKDAAAVPTPSPGPTFTGETA